MWVLEMTRRIHQYVRGRVMRKRVECKNRGNIRIEQKTVSWNSQGTPKVEEQSIPVVKSEFGAVRLYLSKDISWLAVKENFSSDKLTLSRYTNLLTSYIWFFPRAEVVLDNVSQIAKMSYLSLRGFIKATLSQNSQYIYYP